MCILNITFSGDVFHSVIYDIKGNISATECNARQWHCRSVSSVLSTNGRPVTPTDVIPSPYGMGTIAGEFITANLHLQDNVTATLLQHRFPEMAKIGDKLVGHTMERVTMIRQWRFIPLP